MKRAMSIIVLLLSFVCISAYGANEVVTLTQIVEEEYRKNNSTFKNDFILKYCRKSAEAYDQRIIYDPVENHLLTQCERINNGYKALQDFFDNSPDYLELIKNSGRSNASQAIQILKDLSCQLLNDPHPISIDCSVECDSFEKERQFFLDVVLLRFIKQAITELDVPFFKKFKALCLSEKEFLTDSEKNEKNSENERFIPRTKDFLEELPNLSRSVGFKRAGLRSPTLAFDIAHDPSHWGLVSDIDYSAFEFDISMISKGERFAYYTKHFGGKLITLLGGIGFVIARYGMHYPEKWHFSISPFWLEASAILVIIAGFLVQRKAKKQLEAASSLCLENVTKRAHEIESIFKELLEHYRLKPKK